MKYTILAGTAISKVIDIPLHKVVIPSSLEILENASQVLLYLTVVFLQLISWKQESCQNNLLEDMPDLLMLFAVLEIGTSHEQVGSISCCCSLILTTSIGVKIKDVSREPVQALSILSLRLTLLLLDILSCLNLKSYLLSSACVIGGEVLVKLLVNYLKIRT